jgi:hypothetical protein
MGRTVASVGMAVATSIVQSQTGKALGGGTWGAVGGALAGAIVSIGLSYLANKWMPPKRTGGSGGGGAAASYATADDMRGGGRTLSVRQPVAHHRVIYGEVKVGGPPVFIEARRAEGSNKREILDIVIPLAGHPVEAIGDIYFNDKLIRLDGNGEATEEPFRRDGKVFARVWKYRGSPDQGSSPQLMAAYPGKWTGQHRGRGRAYIHAELHLDDQAFPGVMPNITAVVRGRNTIWDPRTGAHGWTANAALCILDYLRAPFGLGAQPDEIGLDEWIAAANIADEIVAALDGTERRYECHGSFEVNAPPRDVLPALLTSCAGHLTQTGGLWRLFTGAWRPPVASFSERDARAPVTFRPWRSRRELANTVRGSFVSPAHSWQPTDYPPVSVDAYRSADAEELPLTLDLPYTRSVSAAQRIARIALEQVRRQRQVIFPANLAGLQAIAGETLAMTLPRFGLAATPFTVSTWRLAEELGVDLTLTEDSPDIYAHDPSWLKALGSGAALNLPNGGAGLAPTMPSGLSAVVQADGSVRLTWWAPDEGDRRYYEVFEASSAVAAPATDAVKVAEPMSSPWTRTGLSAGAVRWWWVRAIDRYGQRSGFAGPVTASVPGTTPVVLVLE